MNEGIVDIHTHAFPDELAAKAMEVLAAEVPGIKYYLDGRISSLLESMDRAGVEKSVVCSIATRPKQFRPILEWSKEIASDRIIPFPSVHPDDPQCAEQIDEIARAGFRGVKMHPYYQGFVLDDDNLGPIYTKLCDLGLVLVMHTGFDIAFERVDRAGPQRILNVLSRFPALKMVATHLGAWEQWDEVLELLVGKPIYMGTSYSLDFMDQAQAKEILANHPAEYVVFGTDSPWDPQDRAISMLKELELGEERERLMFRENSVKLLNLC